ncbi:MAG TPA: type I methionyl aminopeptidase [Flavobacteriales bacterium]|nr:type I methionyl aminopeptidase [Flavobacteriales bacterium]HRJ39897.1 type I methionyl aminopeptidase [Flavobacteriales bacterium]
MGNGIYYKTADEIELMRKSAQLVSKTLGAIAEIIGPGITPLQIDKIAETVIRDNGGTPSFLGYHDYPNTLCVSVNQTVVHGIPTSKAFHEGDIVSVDCGAILNGFHGDHAYTFAIGEIKPEAKKLLQVTFECLYFGIDKALAGNRIGDISAAIQHHAEKNGFGVVRELVGHGLGTELHEDPQVPNYGRKGYGPKIYDGLVIAIEPMINMGTRNIKQSSDGWTITTADNKPSAHFEHDVAVVNGRPDILSTFSYVEEALRKKGAWMPSLNVSV